MTAIERAENVFDIEIESLKATRASLGRPFLDILESIVSCKGKTILIGMGKSGHIAGKIAATMSSLGSCAISISPAECMHGDLGMIQKQDFVIMISYSGESDEMIRIIPNIRAIGATIACITCNPDSTLARSCPIVQVLEGIHEACYMGLAPTSSTTSVLVYGDALAVAAAEMKRFDKRDFAMFHPAGSLGKKLMTRSVDLMQPLKTNAHLHASSTIREAVVGFVGSNSGILPVYDDDDRFCAIIRSEDVAKALSDDVDISSEDIASLVQDYPYYVDSDSMALDALRVMLKADIDTIAVVKDDSVIGIVSRDRITGYGIYL